MGGRGGRLDRSLLERAAACLALLSLLLLTLTSDFLHNHPGADAETVSWPSGAHGTRLAPAQTPASPHRSLPCLACLHHRTPWLGPSDMALEGRQTAAPGEESTVVQLPPPSPSIYRIDLRAPPVSG